MLAEGNIAGWNSPFRQTAVSVSTSKQERMMKKKIGFIDLFIDEWHANHYPDWFRKARRAEEFELGLAWERAPFENRRPLEAWCRDFGMTPARSIEEVVEKSDAVCVLAPANPEVHLELADHALRSGKPVYVDKPFADSLRTAKEIFDIAEKYGTPLMSTSALRCSDELLDGKIKALEPFLFSVTGGGRSFAEYAIHQLEMIVSVMGINVRKDEIAIMKLIGATDLFVRLPFIVEGIAMGIIGAAVPLVILRIMYENVVSFIVAHFSALSGWLAFVSTGQVFRVLVPLCMGIGIGIGVLGSTMSVRKHLQV